MKGKTIILSLMLLLGTGMASAQNTAYTYVKQYNANAMFVDDGDVAGKNVNSAHLRGDSVVSNDGVAVFNVEETPAVMKFEDGNGIMKIGGNIVAQIPITIDNKGALVADFDNQSGETVTLDGDGNATKEVTVTVAGYATYYSPFVSTVYSNDDQVELYAPTFDTDKRVLEINTNTRVDDATIIPIGKAIVLKGVKGEKKTIKFKYLNTTAPTRDNGWGAVEGTTIFMNRPQKSGWTVYTLGYNAKESSVGFYRYINTVIPAGKSYLFVEDASSGAKSSVISFEESFTNGVDSVVAEQSSTDAPAYNILGQRVNANAKGLVIINGKKYVNK